MSAITLRNQGCIYFHQYYGLKYSHELKKKKKHPLLTLQLSIIEEDY